MPSKTYRPKTRAEVARNMSAIRSRENRTETALRKALFATGLRYRKYRDDIPGRPDIAFPAEKVAVFVDGDYWHCRLLVDKGRSALQRHLRRLPVTSRTYWLEKFTSRVKRDREITGSLRRDGWIVLRLWESDIKFDLSRAAKRVITAVQKRRRSSR